MENRPPTPPRHFPPTWHTISTQLFATTYMVADNITFEAQNIEKIQKQKQIIHLHPHI